MDDVKLPGAMKRAEVGVGGGRGEAGGVETGFMVAWREGKQLGVGGEGYIWLLWAEVRG